MLETKPLELIYQGPTNVSQVLSPYSASPPKVLLSGFRSRCHIVIKGAFPDARVHQGLDQLIQLYTRAGFPKEELQSISDQLLIQHQNSQPSCQTIAAACLHVLPLRPCSLLSFLSFSSPPLFRFFLSLSLVIVAFLLLVSSFPCSAFWLKFRSAPVFSLVLHPIVIMDHAQGRAFHHHLARAIMHLNHLASLLPFFEPPFEWEDSMPSSHFRLEGQCPGDFTLLSLYRQVRFHPQWCHMEDFRPTWWSTRNQIFVPSLRIQHILGTMIRLPFLGETFPIRFQCLILACLQLLLWQNAQWLPSVQQFNSCWRDRCIFNVSAVLQALYNYRATT